MAAAVQAMQSSAATSTGLHQTASSSALVLEFVCLFTHDLRRKQKRWQDGRLKYHTFNKRVMVYDERGNFVGDTHWREDFEFGDGEELELERGGTIVQVAECTGSRDQDLSELIDKRAQEKIQRQSAAVTRRHPTLEPAAPQPPLAAAAAASPHFQLRHRPLHHLIGTPTGHHGRAHIPPESPYEQRRQQLEQSPQNNTNRPAKRRKRDVSPPSKSGYAQSLFGVTLTLSGRPMSPAPVRHKPAKPVLARQGDPCPTSSDQSSRDSDTASALSAPRAAAPMPRGLSARPNLLSSAPQRPPELPPRIRPEPPLSSSPILTEESPERDRNPIATDTDAAASMLSKPSKENRGSDGKQRNPLQIVPVNETQALLDSANRRSNENSAKRRLLNDKSLNKVARTREEQEQWLKVRQSEVRGDAIKGMISDLDQIPSEALASRSLPKDRIVDEMAREDLDPQVPVGNSRTELRIKPRKKPGLLMLSDTTAGTKPSLKSRSISARNFLDDSPISSDAFGDATNNRGKSKPIASEDSGDKEKTWENRPNKGLDTALQVSQMEAVTHIDDDPPGGVQRDHPSRDLSESGSKSRERASKRGRRGRMTVVSSPLHETDDENAVEKVVGNLDDDLFETMETTPPRRVSRKKRPEAPSDEDQDGPQLDVSSSPIARKRRSRRTRNPGAANTDDVLVEQTNTSRHEARDEEESDLSEEVTAPRLTKIKKSIRSRELIGFVFDHDSDEEEGDGREIEVSKKERPNPSRISQQNPATTSPPVATDAVEPQRLVAAGPFRETARPPANPEKLVHPISEDTNREQLPANVHEGLEYGEKGQRPVSTPQAVVAGSRDVEESRDAPESQFPFPVAAPQNLNSSQGNTSESEPTAQQTVSADVGPTGPRFPIVSNPAQQQDNAGNDMPNLSTAAQQSTTEVAEAKMSKPMAARRITNPATRGRKAARPADAAGQLPRTTPPQNPHNGDGSRSERSLTDNWLLAERLHITAESYSACRSLVACAAEVGPTQPRIYELDKTPPGPRPFIVKFVLLAHDTQASIHRRLGVLALLASNAKRAKEAAWCSVPHRTPSTSRSSTSHTPFKIVIDPDEETQRMYNEIREEQERHNPHNYVAAQANGDLLSPATATNMTRSFTNESYASSYSGGPPASPIQNSAVTNGGQGKKPRGRRRRPLDEKTRLATAVKRKLKLPCERHRKRKTTCDCYDFSKLEAGYLTRHDPERHTHRQPRSRPRPQLAPTGSSTFGQPVEHHIFGTGGGTETDSSVHNDDLESTDILQSPSAARQNIQHLVNQFDPNTIYLNQQLVQHSIGQPYYPGATVAPSSTLGQLLPSQQEAVRPVIAIGSQRLGQSTSEPWQCEYKSPHIANAESYSYFTAGSPLGDEGNCRWTGQFHELAAHFITAHHPFQEAEPEAQWSFCLACNSFYPGWNIPSGCPTDGCSAYGYPLQQWYYGSTTDESVEEEESLLSGYSDGAFSSDMRGDGDWNDYARGPGGENGGSSANGDGRYGAWASFSSGGGGYHQYQHRRCGLDTDDDFAPCARHAEAGHRATHRSCGKSGSVDAGACPFLPCCCKAVQCSLLQRFLASRLLLNSCRRLLLLVLVHCVATIAILLSLASNLTYSRDLDVVCWLPAGALVLGFVVTWIVKGFGTGGGFCVEARRALIPAGT
ncbi:hypothetical protein DL764_003021 [Monosporascus ibericus]|uniref:5'-3' DNA helicase ZGRF1-like N-terminal domain-containing protein n=1 Tax=Monosporascus ibericus TaxID=155417 RepID=A0A4Q4TI80_9PEZI|nr:hypothetical protein DL764_003021 [Monosporascus ibericus]